MCLFVCLYCFVLGIFGEKLYCGFLDVWILSMHTVIGVEIRGVCISGVQWE
jgi:hypothetical protein